MTYYDLESVRLEIAVAAIGAETDPDRLARWLSDRWVHNIYDIGSRDREVTIKRAIQRRLFDIGAEQRTLEIAEEAL